MLFLIQNLLYHKYIIILQILTEIMMLLLSLD